MKPKCHVLIVDDDDDIARLLARFLMSYDFVAHVAAHGAEMRAIMEKEPVDVIIMDVMLPETSGIVLTRELRQHSRLPVIMLSARADHFDRIVGLECGADDYVIKPFEPRELVARIQAVLRRTAAAPPVSTPVDAHIVHFDGWRFDPEGHVLMAPGGMHVALSKAEFQLLGTFLKHPRRLLSRHQLRLALSGHAAGQGERSIDLLVSRLRQKLAHADDYADMIKTIRGRGYMLDVTPVRGGLP